MTWRLKLHLFGYLVTNCITVTYISTISQTVVLKILSKMLMTFLLQHWPWIHAKRWYPNSAEHYGKQDGIGLQLEELHMIWFRTWELSMNSRLRDVVQLVTSDCYWTTKAHQHKYQHEVDRVYDCGKGIEDVFHLLHQCSVYNNLQKVLDDTISKVCNWTSSGYYCTAHPCSIYRQ